jgi:hypothetical protein
MKRLLLAALAALALPAYAGVTCNLFLVGQSCSFATDTTGGVAQFNNPANLSNIGSGVITPVLTEQHNGTEGGVSTDDLNVNTLPLDDKRDNTNTFTTTFQLNQLGFVTVGGVDYFAFFLDINEPNGGNNSLLSLDTLRIWGRSGTSGETAPFMLNNTNVTSIADLDLIPNIQLVYALGPGNVLMMDYNLFAGSGLGYDLSFLVPTSAFIGLAADSRILFSSAFGLSGGTTPGADAADGFEEWAFLPGAGPRIVTVPEPGTLALLALPLLALVRRRRI